MKYEIEDRDTFKIMKIMEKRLILDLLDPVYKDVTTEVKGYKKDLLIDMSNVEYLDSFAVGFLMDIFRTQLDAGLKMIISGTNDKISTLLRITRVSNVINVFPTNSEAFEAMKTK